MKQCRKNSIILNFSQILASSKTQQILSMNVTLIYAFLIYLSIKQRAFNVVYVSKDIMWEVERVEKQSVWMSFTNVTDWSRAYYISVRFDFCIYTEPHAQSR